MLISWKQMSLEIDRDTLLRNCFWSKNKLLLLRVQQSF